jgi:predicted histone-like DNA-binding protein
VNILATKHHAGIRVFIGFLYILDDMGYRYSVKQKRNGINKKALYYAVPVRAKTISTREIAKELAARSSLTPADIRATLIGLVEVMEVYLHNGCSVKLDDLGIFHLSITSEGHASEEECMPHCVRVNKLCFRADPQIKKNFKEVEFERDSK